MELFETVCVRARSATFQTEPPKSSTDKRIGPADPSFGKPARPLDRTPRPHVANRRVGVRCPHQELKGFLMPRVTSQSWTDDQIKLLVALVERGASASRASVALKRPKLAVQNKARQLGKPFQDVRRAKAARLAREVEPLRPQHMPAFLTHQATKSGG